MHNLNEHKLCDILRFNHSECSLLIFTKHDEIHSAFLRAFCVFTSLATSRLNCTIALFLEDFVWGTEAEAFAGAVVE